MLCIGPFIQVTDVLLMLPMARYFWGFSALPSTEVLRIMTVPPRSFTIEEPLVRNEAFGSRALMKLVPACLLLSPVVWPTISILHGMCPE